MAATRRTSRDIRSDSRLDVIHAVLAAGDTSRNEIVQNTGLSPATVVTIVGELVDEGIIVETKLTAGRIGRPTASLALNATRGCIVGIDVAETYMRAIVFDTALQRVASVELEHDEHVLDPDAVVDAVGRALDQVIAEAGVDRGDVLGVGVSLPGLVQRETGASVVVPNWKWQRVELDHLRERVGLPLVIDNPLRAMVTAELWLGRGRDYASLATVNLGTGVGAGIVLEGKILRGADNSAGEWGHSLLSLDGRLCRCGRRGCVEAYLGAPGIQQTLAEIAPDHPLTRVDMQRDFIGAIAAAIDSDPAVRETISRTAYYLGSALADLVAVVNPEVITLTGWTSWALSTYLLPEAREHLRTQAPGRAGRSVRLDVSAVEVNPVATGMATIALERFLVDAGLLTSHIQIAL